MNAKAFRSIVLLIVSMLMFSSCGKPAEEQPQETQQKEELLKKEETMEPKEYAMTEEYVRWLGRVYSGIDPEITNISWSASGFEVRFFGTKLEAMLGSFSYSSGMDAYIEVLIDGADFGEKLRIGQKKKWYTLAENLTEGEHTVRVIKSTESIVSVVMAEKLRTNEGGELLRAPVQEKPLIEFIGDSIICGHTALREEGAPDKYELETEDANRSYAAVTARRLNADYNCISIAGWTVYKRTDTENGDRCSLAEMYEMTDPANGIEKEWDFTGYAPDMIVVNLGTNDRTLIDYDAPLFEQKYYEFILKLRKHYPDAEILCTMGMMTDVPCQYIESAVQRIRGEGDAKVHYFKQSFQSASHPVESMHIAAGEELAKYIKGENLLK